jgi:hypothetical protein
MNNKHDIVLNIQALRERLKTCPALERDQVIAALKVWEKRLVEWKDVSAPIPEPPKKKPKSKKVR